MGFFASAVRNHAGIGCMGPPRYLSSNRTSTLTRSPTLVSDALRTPQCKYNRKLPSPTGIMLIRHGCSGLPFIVTSTGMGLRQSALSFDARFALTSTYGLTPWILISAVKRKLDIPIGSRADYSSVKRSARTRITPASIKSQSPLNPGPALSNQRMHYFCPHALFLEAMMRHSFQHDTAISDSPGGPYYSP